MTTDPLGWIYQRPPEDEFRDAMTCTWCPICGAETIGRSWTTDICGACAETYEDDE